MAQLQQFGSNLDSDEDLDYFKNDIGLEIDQEMAWTLPTLASTQSPGLTGFAAPLQKELYFNSSEMLAQDAGIFQDDDDPLLANNAPMQALLPSHAGATMDNASPFVITGAGRPGMGQVVPSTRDIGGFTSNDLFSTPPPGLMYANSGGKAGNNGPLSLRKSYTLQPDNVGLLYQSPQFLQQQNASQAPAPGVLTKSLSFDTRTAPQADLSSSTGKIKRQRGSTLDHTSDPFPASFAKPSAHAIPPYLNALQKSRSSGSVDRINRLARAESNLSTQNSFVSEDEDTPHEGNFDWLQDFQQKEGGTEAETGAGGTGQRVTFRACANCKKAHLACDAERPCKRCVHLGKSAFCVDVEHKKRGRPKLPRGEDGAIIRQGKEGDSDEEGKEEHKPKTKTKKKEAKAAPSGQSEVAPIMTTRSPSSLVPPSHGQFLDSSPQGAFSSPIPTSPSTIYDIEVLSVHTLEGYYTMISPECETLFGFLPTDFSLHSIYEFACVDDLELLSSMHRGILSSGVNQSMIIRFKHKLGHLLTCDLAMSVYVNPDTGKHQSIICSTHLLPPNSSSELYDMPPTPEFAKIQDSDSQEQLLNPVYSTAPPFNNNQDPRQQLPYSLSFDKLSNNMRGMGFSTKSS